MNRPHDVRELSLNASVPSIVPGPLHTTTDAKNDPTLRIRLLANGWYLDHSRHLDRRRREAASGGQVSVGRRLGHCQRRNRQQRPFIRYAGERAARATAGGILAEQGLMHRAV